MSISATRLRSECTIVTEPDADALPESLTVLKTALRIEHDADDEYLEQLLREAASQITERTGRQLLTATRRLSLSGWWAGSIDLPFPRLGAADDVVVKYLDTTETEQTLDEAKYVVLTKGTYGRVLLRDSLPELSDEVDFPVYVEYECGYGEDEDAIPGGLRTPIRHLVKEWYENADLNRFTVQKPFPQHVDALLDRWVLRKFR